MLQCNTLHKDCFTNDLPGNLFFSFFTNDAHSVSNCFALFPDHCSTGGDAKKGEGVRGSPEETRPHPTAAIQVSAQRTARRPELNTSCLTSDWT